MQENTPWCKNDQGDKQVGVLKNIRERLVCSRKLDRTS